MSNVKRSLYWFFPLLLVGSLAACLGSLPDLSKTGQQANVQVVTPAPRGTVVLETPTVDPSFLTLTAVATELTPPPPPGPTFDTPNPLNPEGTPKTATPLPATLAPGQTPATAPPAPTVHVGKKVDLSYGTPVPLNELIAQSVRRADGTVDTYLIPPWLFLGTGTEINARLNQLMEIKPGDEILGWTNVTPLAGTPTPRPTQPIHKVVDLAHGTPSPDGVMVVMHVHRTDGTYDEYWLPLSLLKGSNAEINARLDQLMEIQPGDERFWWQTVADPTKLPLPATLAPGQTLATLSPPTRHPGKVVDLSQGTPEPQIIISVRRANGDYDTYHIPNRLFENFTGEAQNQRFNQLMEVKPGDEILGWQWPSNNGPASPISTTVTITP